MQNNPAAASVVTASFTLRTPPQFTFDNPAQWTAWLQQFEDYSFASGLYSAPEETKELPVDQFLRNGIASGPVALVPSNEGLIRMKNPKVIQSELKAATAHYNSITESGSSAREALSTFRLTSSVSETYYKCSMFATNPQTDQSTFSSHAGLLARRQHVVRKPDGVKA
ncbi:uncharacterized protein LOC142782390 [Rhipicephalus microplus]|uniref:uncharacterized protein LOC142782390 n=1 Tax=Rhipicephalus microplus TaxID=6941 RepID=UPI003F6BC7B0